MYSNYLAELVSPSKLPKKSFSPKVSWPPGTFRTLLCGGVSILHSSRVRNQCIFPARSEHNLDPKSSGKDILIDQNQVRRALIRAYMKGEISTDIDMKKFIKDIANDIKGSPTA